MAKCCETHEGTKPPSCSAETPRAIFEAGESKTLHFSISWALTRTLWATPSALHLQHSHKASILRFTPLNPQVQISKKSGRFFVSFPQDSICFKPQGSHLNTALNTITATWFAAWMDIIPAIYPGKYSRISWDVSCPGNSSSSQPTKILLSLHLPTEMHQTHSFHPHLGLQASQHPVSHRSQFLLANKIPKTNIGTNWEQAGNKHDTSQALLLPLHFGLSSCSAQS